MRSVSVVVVDELSVGEMEKPKTCPSCGAQDTAILIVHGTADSPGGVSLKCRTCRYEWADGHSDLRRVS